MRHLSQQLHIRIQGATRPVLVIHQNPDGDALGAASALQEYLLSLKKSSVIFSSTPVPPKFAFLPHAANISSEARIFQDTDLIIVLDSGDLHYAGVAKLIAGQEHKIMNIDHHPTNSLYGILNLVQPTASSTSEIVYNFFRHNNIRLNHRMATALLTGIITDTDSFTNAAASISAFMVSSELIRAGGNLNQINQWVTKNKTINTLRLWGAVLSRLKKMEQAEITYTYITQADLKQYEVPDSESEGLANFLNNLDYGGAYLLLKETAEGKFRGSFRTTRDNIDVAAWAKRLGGGGHKKAAGFTAEGPLEEILKKILTLQ